MVLLDAIKKKQHLDLHCSLFQRDGSKVRNVVCPPPPDLSIPELQVERDLILCCTQKKPKLLPAMQ